MGLGLGGVLASGMTQHITSYNGYGENLFLLDRKSTRLNSSHLVISYAVFCLKKKNINAHNNIHLSTHLHACKPLKYTQLHVCKYARLHALNIHTYVLLIYTTTHVQYSHILLV